MQLDRNPLTTRFTLHRVLFFALAALLSLQLIGLTQHHHDLSTQPDNCASCNLAISLSGGVPSTLPALLISIFTVAYWVIKNPLPAIYTTPYRYLRPLSQAPPDA